MTVIVPGGRLSMPGARATALSWPSGIQVLGRVVWYYSGTPLPSFAWWRDWALYFYIDQSEWGLSPTSGSSVQWDMEEGSYTESDFGTPAPGWFRQSQASDTVTTTCASPTTVDVPTSSGFLFIFSYLLRVGTASGAVYDATQAPWPFDPAVPSEVRMDDWTFTPGEAVCTASPTCAAIHPGCTHEEYWNWWTASYNP